MTLRSSGLQSFLDAALEAMRKFAVDPDARRTIERVAAALATPARPRTGPGGRLPVCALLGDALASAAADPLLARAVAGFEAIEPRLVWDLKENPGATASPCFDEQHANTMIVGPRGLEERDDVWLGATLMAPAARYPDHSHPPEEVYLVMSPGEFRQADAGWFSPGIGGSLYNPPWIMNAMRAVGSPFFAFWTLNTG